MESFFVSRLLQMQCIIILLSVLMLILCAQKTDASVSETWENLKNSETVQHAQKEWARSKSRAQAFVNKAATGKLADDITTYIDNTLMKLFGIRVNELQKTLKKSQQTWLGPALVALWVTLGLVTFYLTSWTSCLVMLSVSVLTHAIYGPVIVATQVIIFIGLCMYFASLIANNIILAAATIVTIYLSSILFGFCRGRSYASPSTLYDIADRVDELGERTILVEKKLTGIEDKLDQLLREGD